MPAGVLRERVRFERRATTAGDGAGNFENAWAPIVEVWARIAPARGRETVLASKLQGVQPVEITVRWSRTLAEGVERLTADDRAVCVSQDPPRVYNITAPPENPDQRRMYLLITAEAGVAT